MTSKFYFLCRKMYLFNLAKFDGTNALQQDSGFTLSKDTCSNKLDCQKALRVKLELFYVINH